MESENLEQSLTLICKVLRTCNWPNRKIDKQRKQEVQITRNKGERKRLLIAAAAEF